MTPMRAKLTSESVTNYGHSERVKYNAIYSQNPEDNSFSAATPSATAEFTISNKALLGTYKPGQQFYVDFTPIPVAIAN